MPAGVSISAVTAAFGVSLLRKVLKIAAKRKAMVHHARQLLSLERAAAKESTHLKKFADADIASYTAFLDARRRQATNAELERRQRKLISVPLNSARCALSALRLCAKAAPLIRGSVFADLASAAILLEAATRATLLCVETNLRTNPDTALQRDCREIKTQASVALTAVMTTRQAS